VIGQHREIPPVAAEAGLVRAIGVRRLTASIINTTVGAGIFVLPATAAAELGPAAPLAYIVCAVAMALVVTCFAAAGSRVSLSGGLYAYTEVAFGPFVGFLAGVLYWLGASFAVASVASALVGSIGVFWPGADAGLPRALILASLFGGLAFVNVRGVARGARVIEIATVAKLLPLFVLAGVGLWLVPFNAFAVLPLPAASDVGRTAIILIFAFIGVEIALTPSGEIENPARTIPRALFLALMLTTVLYLAIQAVAQGLLGAELSTYAAAPLAEAAQRLFGPAGRTLVLAGATISMFGYVSGDLLGTPRALFAFGRDRLLPAWLASVHPQYRTPWIAILVHTAIVCALAISSGFTALAVISNVATLSLYLLCVAASYRLQRTGVALDGRPFVLPAGPLIPAATVLLILWLLSQATREEMAVEAAVLAVASALYAARIWLRRQGDPIHAA
jgi:amino acid transporter